MKTIHEIVSAKQGVEVDFLKRPGVTGVDVGFKYVNGQRTDEVAIRVMVKKKKKDVPEGEKVPEELDGVKTDVIERTYFLHDQQKNRKKVEDVSLQADTGNYNPVKGGISIGPCREVGGFVYVGTLGAIVKDNASGKPLLLSNFHVMCIDNGWHVGDTMAQPGRVDGGTCPANVIGSLQRAVLSNSVDCAVCDLRGRGFSCEISDVGKVNGTAPATLNMPVRKRGRTTGLTYGFVDSISLSVNIDYGDGIGTRTLTNQIDVRPDTAHNAAFGDHGDSGSAVVDGSVNVVGLHFAGSSDGHGIANQIASVLEALAVSVCTQGKSVVKDVRDHPKLIKDGHKDKFEIKDYKEVKLEKLEHKDHIKDKPEIKEIEKLPLDNGPGKLPIEAGPKFSDIPTSPPVEQPPVMQGMAGQQKLTEVKLAPEKGLKEIKEKVEVKDFKDVKDKPEFKEHKDSKHEAKEMKDAKEFKDQKEHKEHKEAKDHKDLKEHKIEIKDHKEPKEIKEHKLEIKEFEKSPLEGPPGKGVAETGPGLPGGIGETGQSGTVEDRIARLEALLTAFSTFIPADIRPDLGEGALSNEPDRPNTGS